MAARVVRSATVQAEPRWLDLDAGVSQVVDLIAEAARGGAELVAFPETFLPGYPWWIWLDSPAWGMQFVARYAENSMTRDGAEMARSRPPRPSTACTSSWASASGPGGSLYMAQALLDDRGSVIGVRRKLKPTSVERAVFGEGDGSDLQVHDTALGKLGALNCWEHFQPLTKYAMYSLGEQIHVASWPSFSLYRGVAHALGAPVNNAASLTYAMEGQAFVLAPCGVIGQAAHDLFCDTDSKRQLLLLQGGGFAQVYGPEGSVLAAPLDEHEEGLLFADLDFSLISVAKSAADPVGHYSRPDVARLLLNRSPSPVVVDRAPLAVLDELPVPAGA